MQIIIRRRGQEVPDIGEGILRASARAPGIEWLFIERLFYVSVGEIVTLRDNGAPPCGGPSSAP